MIRVYDYHHWLDFSKVGGDALNAFGLFLAILVAKCKPCQRCSRECHLISMSISHIISYIFSYYIWTIYCMTMICYLDMSRYQFQAKVFSFDIGQFPYTRGNSKLMKAGGTALLCFAATGVLSEVKTQKAFESSNFKGQMVWKSVMCSVAKR